MPGYHATDGSSHYLVFTDKRHRALSSAAKHFGVAVYEVLSCKLVTWADEYEKAAYVPGKVKVANGCHMRCLWCDKLITEVEEKTVEAGPNVTCDRFCHGSRVARANAIMEAKGRWPGIELISRYGLGHAKQLLFMFPGGNQYVTWKHGEDTVLVKPEDQQAWKEFIEGIKMPA